MSVPDSLCLLMAVMEPPSSIPNVLLEEILDFLGLDDLLLSVMPTCTFWRACALNHRTYWRDISLERDGTSSAHIDLFLLRLSRTFERPVHITVDVDDPRPVIHAVIEHIQQIQCLSLQVGVEHAKIVLDLLRRSPAPLLRRLELTFDIDPWTSRYPYPTFPPDLFACCTPNLTAVDLSDIALPDDTVPPCLSHIVSLSFGSRSLTMDSVTLPISVLLQCTALRSLTLSFYAALNNALYRDRPTWSRLEKLTLHRWPLMESHPGGKWHILSLPIDRIACIELRHCDSEGIYILVDSLPGPLALSLTCTRLDVTLLIEARVTTAAGDSRERRVVFTLLDTGGESHPRSALKSPAFAQRIGVLDIDLDGWRQLVWAGRLGSMPRLAEIVLHIPAVERAPFHLDPSALRGGLSCPGLQRSVLRRSSRSPAQLDAADIAAFMTSSIIDVRMPISLGLSGFTLDGALDISNSFSPVYQYHQTATEELYDR